MQPQRSASILAFGALTLFTSKLANARITPTVPSPSQRSVTFTDTSGNITVNLVAGQLKLFDNRTSGAIIHNAFGALQPDPLVIPAADAENIVGDSIVQQELLCQPAFYINYTANAFNLHGVAHAVTIILEADAVAVVQTGTIRVMGRKTDGSTVEQPLVFKEPIAFLKGFVTISDKPLGNVPAHFALANIPTLTNLTRVDVDLISAEMTTIPLASIEWTC